MILTVTLNPAIDKLYTFETVKSGSVNRAVESENIAGGKSINVAKTLKSLNAETLATGFIAGCFGDFIKAELQRLHIPHKFVNAAGETRISAAVFDKSTGEVTEFLENGFTVTKADVARFLTLYREHIQNLNKNDIVVISGSTAPGCPANIYNKLIDAAREYGIRVILDSSGENLENGIKSVPFMIKPNLAELKDLISRKNGNLPPVSGIDEIKEAAVGLLKYGITYVCVSIGADGAVLACPEGVFYEPAQKIEIKRTVGCGDALVAAFAKYIEMGKAPVECLKYGIETATKHAMEKLK